MRTPLSFVLMFCVAFAAVAVAQDKTAAPAPPPAPTGAPPVAAGTTPLSGINPVPTSPPSGAPSAVPGTPIINVPGVPTPFITAPSPFAPFAGQPLAGGQAVITPAGQVTSGGSFAFTPLVQTPTVTLGAGMTPTVLSTPAPVVINSATGTGIPLVNATGGMTSTTVTADVRTVLLDSSGRVVFNAGAGKIFGPTSSADTRSLGEIARQFRQGQAPQAARTFTNADIERLNQETARDLDLSPGGESAASGQQTGGTTGAVEGARQPAQPSPQPQQGEPVAAPQQQPPQ